ncbi:E3 SUMO-protein ligase CBX4-like [Populus alba x Populus x berolinensis]|uniref:E3 SUMO-protein ligase CBX4-like n=1 Tax=Populus alba x Populus x berolinensis TaxID=444605 RepID=A0AAD6RH07_9ROSI|nr:E3 SUMO-protein ligase CBX4-like [Populus alba x Populus x berolinensis]
MEPSSRSWSPCSIHHHQHPLCQRHHHHHHHPLCQRHHHHNPHLLCSHHHQSSCPLHVSPRFALQAAQHPRPTLSYPLVKDLNLDSTASKETSAPVAQVLQEPECDVLEEEEEEEDDDDDPIFVLTDEWRELFAKSEARRKLEKQQGKKKEKH